MLTKKKAADLIIDNKTGGDQPQSSKYDPRIIYQWIDIARSQIISEEYTKRQNIRDAYLRSKVASIKEDEDRGQRYADIPVNFVSITNSEGGELGIYRVSGTKSNFHAFSILRTGANDVYETLDGENLSVPTVTIEGNKLYFNNLPDVTESVRITMVPTLESIDEEEAIPIPGDKEMDLIVLTSQLMDESKQTVQDKSNDNNSQQT